LQRQAELLAHHPARKPRTVCACQPLASMMAAMVVLNSAITAACFDP
jgi:hypothetical protein